MVNNADIKIAIKTINAKIKMTILIRNNLVKIVTSYGRATLRQE